MRRSLLTIICCVIVGWGATAQADPISPPLQLVFPDITSNYHYLSYTANNAANNFNIDAWNTAINPGSGNIDFDDPFEATNYLRIDATISTLGVLGGGTLEVGGNLTSSYGVSGVLLTGTLTEMGYDSPLPSGLDYFEFVFEIDGGLLATEFGGIGSEVGVIYDTFADVFAANPVAFLADFSISDADVEWPNGKSDLGPRVPEPASLLLIVFAGVALSRRRVR